MATETIQPKNDQFASGFNVSEATRMEEEGKELVRAYDDLKHRRAVFDGLFQDIRELIRPNAEDFTGKLAKGSVRNDEVFDDTPTMALEKLSNGIHSFITNPSSRWFEFLSKSYDINRNYDAIAWFEAVSDRVYSYKRLPKAQWASSMHELYMELGAFGTGVMMSYWEPKMGIIMYKTFPLANCFIDENDQGIVDTVYRKVTWTTRQAKQYFGERLPIKILEERDQAKEWEFVYAVYPRRERNISSKLSKDMPFAAVWFSYDLKEIIEVSGYKSFPYQVPRWSRVCGEVYGRSPAMSQLQNVRVLNSMNRIILQSSQLQAAPPLMIEDENVIGNVNLAPYELIYTQPGAENAVRPLNLGGRIDINFQMIEARQNMIKQGFYNDLFTLPDTAGRDRVTATEFMETRDYQLRQLSPVLSRLEVELLQPQLERDYELLVEHSSERNPILPPAPPSLERVTMDINYMSPAAMAQKNAKGANMQRFLGDLVQLANVEPKVLKSVDIMGVAQDMAELRNVKRDRIRSPEELQAIEEEAAQQQQMAMATQAAPQMAAAMKDLSVAAKNAPGLMGQNVLSAGAQ